MVMAHNPEVFVMLTTLYKVLLTFSLLNRIQTSNFNVMCNLVVYQPTISPFITLSTSAIQVKEPY